MSTVTYTQASHKGTKAASPIYTMDGDNLGKSVWADGIDWAGYAIDGTAIASTKDVLDKIAAAGEALPALSSDGIYLAWRGEAVAEQILDSTTEQETTTKTETELINEIYG